jgi:type I restriction enzyme S subunit
MRDGWTETTLGEVLSRSIGGVWGVEPGSDEEEVTVVRSTEFTKNGVLNYSTGVPRSIKPGQLASRELAPGDILLEKSGGGPEQPVGRVVFVESNIPPRFVCSNFIQLLTPMTESVVPRFLFLMMWMWHYENRTLEYQAQTTGIRNLRTPDYLGQFIALPPLTEQKRIVDVVTSVDAYIDALQQQVDTARTARNAVLHELLSAGGDDWTETTLGNAADTRLGKMLSATTDDGSGEMYPYLRNANVRWGSIDLSDLNEMRFSEKERETFTLLAGDLLICEGGEPGRAALLKNDLSGIYFQKAIHRVRCKQGLKPEFLAYWMHHLTVSELLEDFLTSTTIQHLTGEKLRQLPILLPPLDEQRRIVEIVSSMDEVIQSTEQAITDAKNLRSGLLSDLLSGEHEIPASYDHLLKVA